VTGREKRPLSVAFVIKNDTFRRIARNVRLGSEKKKGNYALVSFESNLLKFLIILGSLIVVLSLMHPT